MSPRKEAAIQDFNRSDRIVVGCEIARAREVMTRIFRPFHPNQSPIIYIDRRTSTHRIKNSLFDDGSWELSCLQN